MRGQQLSTSGTLQVTRRPVIFAATYVRAAMLAMAFAATPERALMAQEITPDTAVEADQGDTSTERAPISGPRELLNLYGVDESHFRMLRDGTPVEVDPSEALLKVLYAVRKFSAADMDRWSERDTRWTAWTADSAAWQGAVVHLAGRVTRVTIDRPVPEVVDRFEIDRYYRCTLQIGEEAAPATVFALSVPSDWPIDEDFSERASVQAVYLKNAAADPLPPHAVFACKRIAWHPQSVELGVLGDLGFDAGLLEHVRHRGSLATASALERECFYQLLAAASRAGTQELLRRTDLELAQIRAETTSRIKRLQAARPLDESQRRELAALERILERALDDQFDAVPLFNESQTMQGRLVALEGAARRIVRIRVDDEDVRARFGIDHYFEIALFTDDSQGNPIVFCVRELPEGLRQGEDVNEAVRVAGFFFKTWGYQVKDYGDAGPTNGDATVRKQLAPLLIGRAPVRLVEPSSEGGSLFGALAGISFVLVLLGIWIGVWYYQRGDRRFHRRAIAHLREPAPGQSLADLGRTDRGAPDLSSLD